jgi:prepilin-type N-terminal cleavage/methylation domain-containing protein
MSRITSRRRKGGFTLIEIMIVVLIIGILLAIAIPNFMKARETSRTKACITNLKQIQTAKEQWAMDNKKASTDTPDIADLCGANLYIKQEPLCPCGAGASYAPNQLDTDPACPVVATYATHTVANANAGG